MGRPKQLNDSFERQILWELLELRFDIFFLIYDPQKSQKSLKSTRYYELLLKNVNKKNALLH